MMLMLAYKSACSALILDQLSADSGVEKTEGTFEGSAGFQKLCFSTM